MRPAIVVLAKEPRPGISKTRLCPPCSPNEAARLAGAALADTIAAVRTAGSDRMVLAFDGRRGSWMPDDFEVLRQRGQGLAERLAHAVSEVGGPALVIGMDTPQVTGALLRSACSTLAAPSVDAVLGPTPDGGYWAVGLKRADDRVFSGVPMSSPSTYAAQLARMDTLELRCRTLPRQRDVDYFDDACAVAETIPTSEFAYALGRVMARIGQRIA